MAFCIADFQQTFVKQRRAGFYISHKSDIDSLDAPNLNYPKKTIKIIVQKEIQIIEAKIRTEKLNIILGNIKMSVHFRLKIFFY